MAIINTTTQETLRGAEKMAIAYGVEIPEVYDGVLYWVTKDGRRVNRFQPGSYLYDVCDQWLSENAPKDEPWLV